MSRTKQFGSQEIRTLIYSAVPQDAVGEHDPPPPVHQFFVPKSHARALNLNVPVVVGSRGVGKSFWWKALQSMEHRALVERFAPDTRIRPSTRVRPGFGVPSDVDRYPSRDVLSHLLSVGRSPRDVWKTVTTWAVLEEDPQRPAIDRWEERVAWIVSHPEESDRLLEGVDRALLARDEDLLVVFDGIDRTSDDWDIVLRHVEGLLQVALDFRAFRRLRVKVFLRTDQFDEGRIGRFPDASKVMASKVDLRWLTVELYALFWQLLGNHEIQGPDFRELVFQKIVNKEGIKESLSEPGLWRMPPTTQFDPKVQEVLFHALTGPYMGEGARRGFPYTWLPSHLADAHGEVSPRSFLISIRAAAKDSLANHIEHAFALHYRSLHSGVQEAARIRRGEIAEHWWVPEVLRDLEGRLEVPFDFADAESLWTEAGTLDRLRRRQHDEIAAGRASRGGDQPWLLPPRLSLGATGVREDLLRLGVLRVMKTGRIDVPDVYRLGFMLAKRGGVPLNRAGEVR
jgi:hypothetical protein